MQDALPSLITSDAQAGLTLAGRLSEQLHVQIEVGNEKIERPGGMNSLMPPRFPREATASILFYAIAAANRGWPIKQVDAR